MMRDGALWRSKLPFDVRISLQHSPHNPDAVFLAAPPELRQKALDTIRRKMGPALGPKWKTIRIIGDLMFDYSRLKTAMANRLSPAKARGWNKSVHVASSRLLALLSDPRAAADGWTEHVGSTDAFLQRLQKIAATAHGQASLLDQRRDDVTDNHLADLATRRLITNLAHWYHSVTGRAATYSRGHSHYPPKSPTHGRPQGPFFSIVSAMLDLVKKPLGAEGLASAIDRTDLRRYQVSRLGSPSTTDTLRNVKGRKRVPT